MKFIADLHTHTLASSHAYSTITENSAAASAKGLKFLAMTDHSIEMPGAPHIWFYYNMTVIPRVLNGVFILRGVEANIMDYKGNIDVEPRLYNDLDWIVASFHDCCCMPGSTTENTSAYIGALENPRVCCIGHPDSDSYDFDIKAVCKACAQNHKAIELNVSRLKKHKKAKDRYKEILSVCAAEGTMITVDSDAHFYDAIGDFELAEQLLEEIGFPEELVLNTDAERLKSFVERIVGKNIFA